jgi:hypothetical protein
VGVAALAAVGVASVATGARPRRDRAAVLVGLAVTAAAFVATTSVTRAVPHGLDGADEQRYVHIMVALALPLVAAGIERLHQSSSLLAVAGVAVLAVGVPGNVDALDDDVPPNTIAAYTRSPALDAADPDRVLHPLIPIPVRDLQDAATNPGEWADAEVPRRDQLLADMLLAVELAPLGDDVDVEACELVPGRTLALRPGDPVPFVGDVDVTAVDGEVSAGPLPWSAHEGGALVATMPIVVRVDGREPGAGLLRC